MKIVPIPRIEPPTLERFREIVAANEPVVLVGLAKRWPCSEWTPERVKQLVGDVTVVVGKSESGISPDLYCDPDPVKAHEIFRKSAVKMKVNEVVDRLVSDPVFARKQMLFNMSLFLPELRPLLEDVRVPEYVDLKSLAFAGFWLSGKGVQSSLHFDSIGCHNLNAQLRGAKEANLFSPADGGKMYPFSPTSMPENNYWSQVNMRSVDHERFPRFKDATCHRAVLEAGDVLFQPALWFHSYDHIGSFNVNVNFWWYKHAFEITPTFRRWSFVEHVGSYFMHVAASKPDFDPMRDIPPEVFDFVGKMSEFLLTQDSSVVFASTKDRFEAQTNLRKYLEAVPNTGVLSLHSEEAIRAMRDHRP